MQSNKAYHYLIKYTPLLIGILFIGITIENYITLDHTNSDKELEKLDLFIYMLTGCFFIILYLFFKDKYALAEVKNRSIKLIHAGNVIEKNWIEVESVTLIPFLFPPIYKIRLLHIEDYLLFTGSGQGGNILGFTFDSSEMGSIIQKKKRELNI